MRGKSAIKTDPFLPVNRNGKVFHPSPDFFYPSCHLYFHVRGLYCNENVFWPYKIDLNYLFPVLFAIPFLI
jgi:hypothetical protein